jgi:pimeloyl-ACP methyl ester carboxylesterase
MVRRLRLTSVPVLALAAAVLGTSPARAEARESTGGDRASAAQTGPCTGLPDIPQARCGSVEVPLDRANPGLGSTTVAFALLPRRNASVPSEGTILFNPGGPGDPTIANAAGLAARFGSALERRDLLLVDPRGTGRSDPITCRAFGDAGLVFAPRSRFVRAIGACGVELGSRAGMYSSAAVADDFEAVRAALGLNLLDLWGESYGTYLMPVYAARHPAHVRAMVLSGAYPIDFDPWGLDRLGAARRGFRLVCARTGACRGEAVLRDVAAVASRLRRHPVTLTVTAGMRRVRTRLDEAALASLVYTGGAAAFFGALPGAVASARAGDIAPLRRLLETRLLITAFVVDPRRAGAANFAQGFATQCHDYPRAFSFADPPAARRAAYERARSAVGRRAFFPFSPAGWTAAGFEAADTCIAWPNDPTAAPPLAPGTQMPDVPVLVLSGELDANTPSFAGRQVARQFSRARFVEIPNEGHTPTGSPCALRLGGRFLQTLTVNARACTGTGRPPRVARRAARRAAGLSLVEGAGTPDQRRALSVVVATANDVYEQAVILSAYGRVRALRGGRYVARGRRSVQLARARVVRDASVSGRLVPTARRVTGTLRLGGRGIPDGRLRVRLSARGRGLATGTLDGLPVRLAFRFRRLNVAADG